MAHWLPGVRSHSMAYLFPGVRCNGGTLPSSDRAGRRRDGSGTCPGSDYHYDDDDDGDDNDGGDDDGDDDDGDCGVDVGLAFLLSGCTESLLVMYIGRIPDELEIPW